VNNFWKKADTIILAHEPNPPEYHIQMLVELSGWSEDIWRSVYREEEMRQAVGRIREPKDKCPDGTPREQREVYIFPNTGVDKGKNPFESELIPQAQVIYHNELEAILEELPSRERLDSTIDRIIMELPTSRKRIKEIVGGSRRRTNKYIGYLINKGFIEDTGRGDKRYEKTDKARASEGRRPFRIEAEKDSISYSSGG
jgi:predicted transcriptional regulator